MSKPRSLNLIFYTILSCIVIVCFWVYTTEIEEIIRAEGAVEPAGQVRTVSSRYGGVVREIRAQVGNKVSEKQVIVNLNEEEAKAELDQNITTIVNLEGEVARLEAESISQEKISFPSNTPEKIINDQSLFFLSRRALLERERQVFHAQIGRANQKIKESEKVIEGLSKLLSIKLEEFDLYRPLVEQGVEPRAVLITLKTDAQQLRNDIEFAREDLLVTKTEIKTLQQRQLELIFRFRNEALEAYTTKQNEIRVLKTLTASLRERLKNSQLTSPVDGIVTKVEVSGAGTVVRAGEPLVEIIPISSTMSVKARLLPKDIASLKIGQLCKIALNAYDYTKYGKVSGFISKIARNTTISENGDAFYDIWIEASSSKLSKSEIKPDIVPGMLVQIEIIGRKRSILEYILKPILEVSSKALTER